MIGRALGHYRIVEKIGAGGMGEVYRARDERLERDVAIKVLPSGTFADEAARRRFHQEALALSRLNHPHIATIFDFDDEGGVDFLVMEYIAGRTLAEKLAEGPLPEEEVARLGSQVASALEEAHEQGVVHRDLKPGNIQVTPKGHVRLLDFGLAKLLEPSSDTTGETLTKTQGVIGTLPYMAPEQLRGDGVDHRADIWAAGAVLYAMATGRRPFDATLATALAADIQYKPVTPPRQLNPQISSRLEGIVMKCLEKDPAHRYQTAGELTIELSRLAESKHLEVPARPPGASVGRLVRYGGAGLAASALLLLTLLALDAGGVRSRLARTFGPATPKIDSLAVLPLKNLMGDPQQDYFVEGMHDALITELTKISALKVISRTSTLAYRQTNEPLPEIARKLNVDGIIEGSVFREGDRVRITVQLIHGPSDHHFWGESYERELRGILALHRELAQAIANEIQVKLTPQERVRLAGTSSVDPKAYELYVAGRHHWNQRSIQSVKQAVESFRKALDRDPGYAPAYAALADCYMLLGEQGGMPQKEARSQAVAALRKALELDETLAEAHATLGYWKLHHEWSWRDAEQAFKRAIELNPGYAAAHQAYGRSLGFMGRFDEALVELLRARELDPFSVVVNAYIGQIYIYSRQYDRAADHLQKLDPNHPLVRHNLGELCLAQGRFWQAIIHFERSVELNTSSHYLAMLGCAYARANRRQEALRILNELERRSKEGLVSAFDMASLHTALGETEPALAWLEQGYEQRDVWLVELKAWPWFESLLPDPRFQDLLRRMNFPAL